MAQQRSGLITLVLGMLVTVSAAGGASGHTRVGTARGFKATIERVQPPLDGLEIDVVGGDDQLRLTNDTATRVLISGYQGEPYLRFDPDGVYANTRSPATYLSRDRFARVAVPASADASARPRWRRLTTEHRWQWHDHRIHWMDGADPPVVAAAPGKLHRIFAWTVRGRAGSQPLAIAGALDYAPPKGARPLALTLAPLFALLLVGGIAAWLLGRRSTPA